MKYMDMKRNIKTALANKFVNRKEEAKMLFKCLKAKSSSILIRSWIASLNCDGPTQELYDSLKDLGEGDIIKMLTLDEEMNDDDLMAQKILVQSFVPYAKDEINHRCKDKSEYNKDHTYESYAKTGEADRLKEAAASTVARRIRAGFFGLPSSSQKKSADPEISPDQ